jgi:hypothetical protein
MARYRCLQDVVGPGGQYFNAGDTISTVDVGGTLPVNWTPAAACEPLDAAAVNAYYAAGPQVMPILIRQHWSGVFVASPVTYWKQVPGGRFWQLAGTNLPPISI